MGQTSRNALKFVADDDVMCLPVMLLHDVCALAR